MRKRDYADYLQDIIESINEIGVFIKNMTSEEFARDKKTVNAVIRSIEVIGEATKKLPGSITEKYPSIPWKKMAGMRNKMIHEYFGIDMDILWKVASGDIPSLKNLIENVIENQGK